MLIINKDTANKLNIVCDDILTLTDPVYLWRFVNKTTQVENLIELENQLPSNPRFDQFNLTLPTDLDLESGEYEWFVYESPLTGETDYSTMNLLSSGDLRVNSDLDQGTSYTPTAGQNYEYNG